MASADAALEIEIVANDPVPTRARATGEWTFRGLKERRDYWARAKAALGIPAGAIV